MSLFLSIVRYFFLYVRIRYLFRYLFIYLVSSLFISVFPDWFIYLLIPGYSFLLACISLFISLFGYVFPCVCLYVCFVLFISYVSSLFR